MKKTILFTITLILSFTCILSVYAENTNNTIFTVVKAQSFAAANNRQAVIDDLEIKAKESALKQAIENAETVGSSYTFEGALDIRIKKYVNPMEAERALELAKMSKQKNSRQLKHEVKKSFLNILLAQKELETEKKKLEFSKIRLDLAQARYSMNTITKQDLDSAQYNYDSKMIDAEAVREELLMLDINLKDQLGLAINGDPLVLDGIIERESFPETDIDKVVSSNIEVNVDVYSAAAKLEAAKKTMELTEELLKPGRVVYDDYLVNVEITTRDYEAALRNREMNIRNTYNELLNMKDSVELAEKYEELQLKMLDNAKTKYDKGQMSHETYITFEEQYLDAVFNKYKAICAFNVKKGEFINMTENN